MRHFQCGQTVKRGQRKIRKDQVNAAAFKRRHKISAGFHTGEHTSDAVGFQSGFGQRDVVGIIFQVQDADGWFHFRNLPFPEEAASAWMAMFLVFRPAAAR